MDSPLAKQVATCNRRARQKGIVGTLSVFEWQRALNHFDGRCAYCQDCATTIDHFIPIAFGGGTTYSNCVPSCERCNRRKGSSYPEGEAMAFIASDRLAYVRSYLEAIGVVHQKSFEKLWERLPHLARAQKAIALLKHHCEDHVLQFDDDYTVPYALLYCSIFGVEWDPPNYYQVLVSLDWQKQHTVDPMLKIICDDARQFLQTTIKRLEEAHRSFQASEEKTNEEEKQTSL